MDLISRVLTLRSGIRDVQQKSVDFVSYINQTQSWYLHFSTRNIWTNDGQVYWRLYAWLSLVDLISRTRLLYTCLIHKSLVAYKGVGKLNHHYLPYRGQAVVRASYVIL